MSLCMLHLIDLQMRTSLIDDVFQHHQFCSEGSSVVLSLQNMHGIHLIVKDKSDSLLEISKIQTSINCISL